jgi:VTC domain
MPRPAAASPQPELELKYLMPGSRAAFVRSWLEGVVHPERAYPPALVVTTYYDTPGLDLLDEKINSDHLKTKVRVRWYAPLDGGPPAGPVFVECKGREGATREKRRVTAEAEPGQLAAMPLSAPEWNGLLLHLRAGVPDLPLDLAPVLRLAYARHRYLDARGARISLDAGIVVQAVNPARLHAPARPDPLPHAVFEYKGHGPDLPAHVAPVTRLGARRSAFSKYLACYQHVTGDTF